MSKFNKGDKVVPVSKSFWGGLEDSVSWRKAKEMEQPFLYVTRYDTEDGQQVVVASEHERYAGDYFLESDLVPYIEKESAEMECQYKVGDTFYFNGVAFKIDFHGLLDYHFVNQSNGMEVYTCYSTPDRLVKEFTDDYLNGRNYVFNPEPFEEELTVPKVRYDELKEKCKYAECEVERQVYIAEERRKEVFMWEQKYTEMQMITSQMERELEREELSHGNTKAQLSRDIEARDMTINDQRKVLEEMNSQVERMNEKLEEMTVELTRANKIIDALLKS
jgi:hypothetical protein